MLTLQSPKLQTAVIAHDYVSAAESSPEFLDRLYQAIAAHDPVQATIDLQAEHAIREWDGDIL